MQRLTCLMLLSSTLLCACQPAQEPIADTPANTAAEVASAPENPAPAPAEEAPASRAPLAFTPTGIESCDAFMAAVSQCYTKAKVHPNALAAMAPQYEAQFKMWGRMKDSKNMAGMLASQCQTQVDKVLPEVIKGWQCE